jgi:hypothetical protein
MQSTKTFAPTKKASVLRHFYKKKTHNTTITDNRDSSVFLSSERTSPAKVTLLTHPTESRLTKNKTKHSLESNAYDSDAFDARLAGHGTKKVSQTAKSGLAQTQQGKILRQHKRR